MKKVLSIFLAVLLMFSFVIIPVSANEGASLVPWDGTTVEKPIGEGTEANPYLISSGSHLLWMSKQIGNGTADNVVSDPFSGTYFKQVGNIDLGGNTMKSIGYYFESTVKYYAFSGVYDGQGYTIKNGTIQSPNMGHGTTNNYRWASGLFGITYGATIKNLSFDNITAYGKTIVGIVAGRAVSTTESPDGTFNTFENITVSDTCKVIVTNTFESGKAGGIVGGIENGIIKNCINNADVEVDGNKTWGGSAGGIAGSAGEKSIIGRCINNGDVIVNASVANTFTQEGSFGGVVGTNKAVNNAQSNISSPVNISNSYNTGSFICPDVLNATIAYSGILGGTVADADGIGASYIDDCYNLNGTNTVYEGTINYRVSGIVGSAWAATGKNAESMYVNDCFSVDVLANGGRGNVSTTAYTLTNEYIVSNNTLASGKKALVDNGCMTKTYNEIKVLTAAIDISVQTAIDNGKYDGSVIDTAVKFKGVQETSIQDNKYGVRFIATVDKLEYDKVGFEVSATFSAGEKASGVYNKDCSYVYNTLICKDSAGIKSYSAADLGGNYIMALSIINIPVSTEVATLTVKAYTETNGTRTYSDTYTVVYTNGVFTSISK